MCTWLLNTEEECTTFLWNNNNFVSINTRQLLKISIFSNTVVKTSFLLKLYYSSVVFRRRQFLVLLVLKLHMLLMTLLYLPHSQGCYNLVSIANCYKLVGLEFKWQWTQRFSLFIPISTDPGAHSVYCAMVPGALSWEKSRPSIPIQHQDKEWVELYLCSPSVPSGDGSSSNYAIPKATL